MERLVSRSISSIQWRGRALLRSVIPDRPSPRLCPPGMTLDRLGLPLQSVELSARDFLFPIDFLPDSASLAGLPIDDFKTLVELHDEPRDNDHLVYLLKNHGQAAVEEPVVVTGLKDGRWMVLHGERVVAAALNLGLPSIAVQVLPLDEALAGINDLQKTFYPRRRYQKNLNLINNLGVAVDKQDESLLALASEFRRKPLVRMAPVYQPLPFPEFQGLAAQAANEATYTRLGMILDHLPDPSGKKVLDLGCNIGFFMFSLAFRGCRVSGLDLEPRFIEVGRKVAAAKGIEAQFVQDSLQPGSFGPGGALADLDDHPSNDPEGKPWDLITSFSMLQWVEKQHDLAYCRRILKEISHHTRALLVDIPVNCAGVSLKAPVGREISWLEELLRDSCDFREYSYVGKVAPYKIDWRHVFYCQH